MKNVTIHTDGGCQPNPGPGGWAAVLQYGAHTKELSGFEPETTNNRMELLATIGALELLRERCAIELFTDSTYVRNGITKWIHGWKKNGWKTAEREPVKNAELWRRLDIAAARHEISGRWLKGHAGHALNERCDVLAGEAIAKAKRG